MSGLNLFPLVAVAIATLAASATDLWKFKVYNALTFPTFLIGLAASTWLGGWQGLVAGLLGSALGLGLLVIFFAAGGVGAGDVKLLMAIGAWLGPQLTCQVFVASAFAAGLYAVILVWVRGGAMAVAAEIFLLGSIFRRTGSQDQPAPTIETEVQRPDRRRRLVPFGAMTCVGFFATMAWWGSDLEDVWPPYDAPSAVSTASNLEPGGTR